METTNDNKELMLGFIRLVGEETDGLFRYEFVFTDNIDEFWGDNFEYKPCCLCNGLTPLDEYVTEIKIVRTKLKFDLIQDSCCFGFQDCADGIIALAWENVDEYDEYPEEGRCYFMFGDSMDEVKEKLAVKNVLMGE